MKKWLIFIGGVVTGMVLTFVFALIFYLSHSDLSGRTTWFEKPGDVIDIETFEVFQVLSEDAALVYGESYEYSRTIYLLTNDEGKYYYDDEVVKVPDGKVVRQIGLYQYQTKSEFNKTVPIIQIMNK
ncbi:MAG: hypothetical protein K2M96_06630 [Prevotella sp.]|nr:hypothetical protein [Prevotella sp.]MDE7456369.1 hypothetical protein [Prevotella sp.]